MADATSTAVFDLADRITSEGQLGMTAIARSCYPPGTNKSTPARHHLRGHKLPDGTTVYLEAIRIGRKLVTSRAAVMRFFAAINAPVPAAPQPHSLTPAARNRAAVAAHAELAAALGGN